ncbi:MAG: TonB family protein [Francisellaceae bacterium]
MFIRDHDSIPAGATFGYKYTLQLSTIAADTSKDVVKSVKETPEKSQKILSQQKAESQKSADVPSIKKDVISKVDKVQKKTMSAMTNKQEKTRKISVKKPEKAAVVAAKKMPNRPERRPLSDHVSPETFKGSQKNGLGGDSDVAPDYTQRVLIYLQRFKYYPPLALKRGMVGRAEVVLTIDCQGNLIGYKITHSTGSSVLDEAVTIMLKNAGRLPTDKRCQGSTHISIPVIFQLEK